MLFLLFPTVHFKGTMCLCDKDISCPEVELCIKRKLLLGGLDFQLFIDDLHSLDL